LLKDEIMWIFLGGFFRRNVLCSSSGKISRILYYETQLK